MDFFEIIDTRQTNRVYGDYIPPKEDIERIIESARVAPSAMNQQNWKFIAVYNKDVKERMASAIELEYKKIADSLTNEMDKKKALSPLHHSTFFKNAPVVVVCAITKAPNFYEDILEKTNLYTKEEMGIMRPNSHMLSMGGAIENILFSAHSLGLRSCWMVAPVLAQKSLKDILDLAENDWIVTLLPIGKPKEKEARPPKKPLDDVMRIIE